MLKASKEDEHESVKDQLELLSQLEETIRLQEVNNVMLHEGFTVPQANDSIQNAGLLVQTPQMLTQERSAHYYKSPSLMSTSVKNQMKNILKR